MVTSHTGVQPNQTTEQPIRDGRSARVCTGSEAGFPDRAPPRERLRQEV